MMPDWNRTLTKALAAARPHRTHNSLRMLLACVWCALLLSGCGGVAATPAPPTPPPASTMPAQASGQTATDSPDLPNPDADDDSTPGVSTQPPADSGSGDVCASMPKPNTTPATAKPATAAADLKNLLSYTDSTNTIAVAQGANATIPAISQALNRPELLRELAPGEWFLAANLSIQNGGALVIGGTGVQRLRLKSDDQGFVWIKALGGQLTFQQVCVTSWDMARSGYDLNAQRGRSFVLARDGAHMNIYDSVLGYLGYHANESYGLAWRLEGTTGEIINSHLAYNFYGLYSFEASDLVIRGNEVHHSVRYGIDPHTRSNRLTIEQNISHHNGKQGIILAQECEDSVIRNNTVYANTMHGIVIYQNSNNNRVEGNTSYGNGYQGININDSNGNTVQNNTVYENTLGGIGVDHGAKKNTIISNTVHNNQQDGITLTTDATANAVSNNEVRDNGRYGIYVKSSGNQVGDGNRVFGNQIGVYLNTNDADAASVQANDIHDNHEANVRAKGAS